MNEDSPLHRVAERLGISPDEAMRYLDRFNNDPTGGIVRSFFVEQIMMMEEAQMGKLRSVKTPLDEIRYTQGVADGLKLACTQINDKTITLPAEEPKRTV